MPRAPITRRTLLYSKFPDGTFHFLQWSLVNTSMGSMMEPRYLPLVGRDIGDNPSQWDTTGEGFDAVKEIDEHHTLRNWGLAGYQLPRDYNV